MKPLRTMLFVPGHKLPLISKARTLPADAVILDLEDSVPPNEKSNARKTVQEQIPILRSSGSEVYVRINGLSTHLAEDDLKGVVCDGLAGIVLPKTETTEDVLSVNEMMSRLEGGRSVGKIDLMCVAETALGVMNAFGIAKAVGRTKALIFGSLDFVSDLGTTPTKETYQLIYARSHIAVAAKAAKILAIDTVYPDFRDTEGLVNEATLARHLGFNGKAVIHPDQIDVVNKIFTPSAEELKYASKIVETYEEAVSKGLGSVSLDNKMVDDAVYDRAVKMLQLAKEIERMETERKSHSEVRLAG